MTVKGHIRLGLPSPYLHQRPALTFVHSVKPPSVVMNIFSDMSDAVRTCDHGCLHCSPSANNTQILERRNISAPVTQPLRESTNLLVVIFFSHMELMINA